MRKLVMMLATAATVALLGAGSAAGVTIVPEYFPAVDRDVAVSTSTAPTTAVAGDFALLSSIVTNHGRVTAVVAFTDTVPAGLTVVSAAAGSGSCTILGQTVACKMLVDPADSAPVNVVVTPTAAGTYSNSVSVAAADGQTDPNSGNDRASATLAVSAATPPPTCTVPSLKRTPMPVARRVLGLLHCKAGKAKRVHSRGVATGQVIRTTPQPGTYKEGKIVALTVSSGPAKAKRRGR